MLIPLVIVVFTGYGMHITVKGDPQPTQAACIAKAQEHAAMVQRIPVSKTFKQITCWRG